MSTPDFANAVVGKAKMHDYLLSPTHPTGHSKARFFLQSGFDRKNWRVLERALIALAQKHAVSRVSNTEFGVKYTIEGPLVTPFAKVVNVRTVWMTDGDDSPPRFVTAYPL